MFEVIRGIAGRFLALPPYGIAATSLFLLYAVQAEIRFCLAFVVLVAVARALHAHIAGTERASA